MQQFPGNFPGNNEDENYLSVFSYPENLFEFAIEIKSLWNLLSGINLDELNFVNQLLLMPSFQK